MRMNCKNCQATLSEDAHYCNHCGQRVISLNRPFLSVTKEYMHELLDIDGRLSLTLRTLVFKPGQLTHAFNQGKIATYTPPLRLYLAISIIFFILFSEMSQIYAPSRQITDSTISYYSKAMFVLFPFFALLVQAFFRQSYFIGNLVFSMHIHSVVYLALIIIAPLEANEKTHIAFLVLQIPPMLYLIWYIYTAFITVYRQVWWEIAVKGMSIFFIYMAVLGIVFDILIDNIL